MSDHHALEPLGYGPRWQALFVEQVAALAAVHPPEHLSCGRVLRADRGSMLVATATDVVRAAPSTRLVKAARSAAGLPTTGDWVVLHAPPGLDRPLVEAVLERTAAFTRGDPGEPAEVQIVAANVDVMLVVHPVHPSANLRRIERELAVAWESGSTPVVVLTKADLAPGDAERQRDAVEATAVGVAVHLTSVVEGRGVAELAAYGAGHRTVGLIGPSGAGKSTLVNALIGERRQHTLEVRAKDGRGRHATVARELIPIPGGGVLLDTPGMRAVEVAEDGEGIAAAFADIDALARECRFRDCAHAGEPGCAVVGAVEAGALPAGRLASYHKLQREARAAARKTDARLRAEETRKWKIIHKSVREVYRLKGKEQ